MNKAIMIGLSIILIVLAGCSASYTCYNPDNQNVTVEVSTTSIAGHEAYILEECRKQLCEVVIIKNE